MVFGSRVMVLPFIPATGDDVVRSVWLENKMKVSVLTAVTVSPRVAVTFVLTGARYDALSGETAVTSAANVGERDNIPSPKSAAGIWDSFRPRLFSCDP